MTTISEEYKRSSVHGIRYGLIEKQSKEVGVPLEKVWLPEGCSNHDYEKIMTQAMKEYEDRGVEIVAFADIFLEDVRKYREDNLSSTDLEGYWPLWGLDSSKVVSDFLKKGFKATVVCSDGEKLGRAFAGRGLDQKFLDDLPEDVDPCGENGEYHTFVWDGPVFKNPIQIERGEVVEREIDGSLFCYCDILSKTRLMD